MYHRSEKCSIDDQDSTTITKMMHALPYNIFRVYQVSIYQCHQVPSSSNRYQNFSELGVTVRDTVCIPLDRFYDRDRDSHVTTVALTLESHKLPGPTSEVCFIVIIYICHNKYSILCWPISDLEVYNRFMIYDCRWTPSQSAIVRAGKRPSGYMSLFASLR